MQWIIHILIMSIVGILMLIFDRKQPSIKASTKYYLWSLLIILFAIPITRLAPFSLYTFNTATTLENSVAQKSVMSIDAFTPVQQLTTDHSLWIILLIIWAMILLIFSVKTLISWLKWHRYINRCGMKFTPLELRTLVGENDLCDFETLKIKVVKVPICYTPSIVGVFNPVIIIPDSIKYSSEELRLVLLHEYYHLYRKDHLIRFILNSVTRLFWFVPFIYVFRKEAIRYCELSCDDYVLKNGNRKNYFEAILKTACSPTERNYFATVQLTDVAFFKERMERIVQHKVSTKSGYTSILVMLLLMISLSFLVGCDQTSYDQTAEQLYYNQLDDYDKAQYNAAKEAEILDNQLIEIETRVVQEEVLDYADLSSFEYTHVVRYPSWNAAIKSVQKTLVVDKRFEGFKYRGTLDLTAFQAVDSSVKNGAFDVYYVGTMYKNQ